jgi:hypothetical protein
MSDRTPLKDRVRSALLNGIAVLNQHPVIFFGLVALAGMAAYRIYAVGLGVEMGFPLDDAWIHQTYARSLARSGQFAFVPGQPSAGSTAPLWTWLIAIGYFLRLPYAGWTLFLGWISLTAAAWGAWRLCTRLFPGRPALALAAGSFCAAEWHLVWAAVSGMETALFCALAVIILSLAVENPLPARKALVAGLLGGALTLTRPEGVVLVALVGADLWASWLQRRARRGLKGVLMASLMLFAGWLAGAVPFLMLNILLAGSPFPNTFYAKQMEYSSIASTYPLLTRWLRVLYPTTAGAQILLVPGFLWSVVQAVRHSLSRWQGKELPAEGPASALPMLYWLLFGIIYALRLPVNYQHGRYLMPVIPLYIVLGMGGTALLLERLRSGYFRRLLQNALLWAGLLLTIGFIVLGARAYTDDLRFINGKMVAVARWINAHTPENALIAAHDIGAIGYFTQRPLLDLAGLISPEVIPILRDEDALWEWLTTHGAQYLVTFPSWYPRMTARPELEQVFQTDSAFTRAYGEDNMVVYRIRSAGR